jgi:nodulation protein E
MVRAMRGALADAGAEATNVAYINAHGTGTRQNDLTETQAMKTLFGEAAVPPVSSTKGVMGHALGAAGGLEAVATVLAMRHSVAPPTANYDEHDPACDIDVIPNTPRAMDIPFALSNSFAFGGINATLAFAKVAA